MKAILQKAYDEATDLLDAKISEFNATLPDTQEGMMMSHTLVLTIVNNLLCNYFGANEKPTLYHVETILNAIKSTVISFLLNGGFNEDEHPTDTAQTA